MFNSFSARPMLLGRSQPFSSPEFIFEIKFDGARTLAYVNKSGVVFRSRNNRDVTNLYPELQSVAGCISGEVILDGEVVVFENGTTSFSAWQRRAHLKSESQILKLSKSLPAHFVVFDILYKNGKVLTSLPLMSRKQALEEVVTNGDYVTKTTWVEEKGEALFSFAKENGLEGIVAKRKHSVYKMGERSDSWLKIKNLQEEDFLVVGYEEKQGRVVRLILAKQNGGRLLLSGSVAGIDRFAGQVVRLQPKSKLALSREPNVTWIKPKLTAVVRYIEKTDEGNLRQPVFCGFKSD